MEAYGGGGGKETSQTPDWGQTKKTQEVSFIQVKFAF